MAEIIPVYFPSLFWQNVSPEDLYPENKEIIYGKLNELLYNGGNLNEARYRIKNCQVTHS